MGFYFAQFLTGLANTATLFLVASGLSIIFGVTRIVNFAHGSFYMLGAYIAWSAMQVLPGFFGFWTSILLSGLAVGVIGVIVEICVLRPVYRAPELFQLVATFGVILVIQDLALLTWGSEDLLGPRAPGFEGAVTIMGQRVPAYDLVLIAITPAILFALWYLFNRTRVGILVRAATEDREMVGALGVNQAWLFTGVFFLGSMLAGIGGAMQLPKGNANLEMDFGILAPIFVVVVIGGMGSIPGAFIAAFLISELNVFGVKLIPQSTLVLMFIVMVVVLVIRPWGLLGRPEAPGQHGQVGEPDQPITVLPPKARLAALAVLVALIIVPFVTPVFIQHIVIEILIFCLFAASLHFIMGPGGLVSFGHAAYFGGGAYAAGLAVTYWNAPMELMIVFAPLVAGLIAIIVGWFCVRLTGVYFAMLTLAFAQVIWSIVFQWGEFTGGDDGISGTWPSSWASEKEVYYFLVLALSGGGIILIRHILHSPFGYAMRGARDSVARSEAIGIDVRLIQWAAFAVAGALAGLSGVLLAYLTGSIHPDLMGIARSFDGLIAVLLGGVKTLTGPLTGSAVFLALHDVLARFEYWRLAIGLLIIVLVVLFPQGITGYAREKFGHLLGLRREA